MVVAAVGHGRIGGNGPPRCCRRRRIGNGDRASGDPEAIGLRTLIRRGRCDRTCPSSDAPRSGVRIASSAYGRGMGRQELLAWSGEWPMGGGGTGTSAGAGRRWRGLRGCSWERRAKSVEKQELDR
jgi:hypothetical protein